MTLELELSGVHSDVTIRRDQAKRDTKTRAHFDSRPQKKISVLLPQQFSHRSSTGFPQHASIKT
jgi:hypothetical protein